MKINSIILENFRNYKNLELDFDESRNIIVGENAQGKTNLIEAIYLTAFARSFRTSNSADLISFGESSARVSTYITSEDIDKNINIVIRSDGKKMIKKDGKLIRKTTELLNNVVVIIFSPDDLRIIKDSPDRRRTFINRELSQMRPMYYDSLRRYNEALREKNALLKGYFNVKKKTFSRADNLSLNDARGGREVLKIEYKTACDFVTGTEGRDILYSQIYHNRDRDIYNGYASLGPHRDDIEFYINGKDAKKYGSQGQQRTIALSLKLAEIRIAKQMLDEPPVLLLDDVLSELDLDRQKFLVSEIDDVQLFITSAELNDEVIKDLRGGTLFRIEEGTVTRVDKY